MEFDDFLKIVRGMADGKIVRAYLDYEYLHHICDNLNDPEMVAMAVGRSTVAIVEKDGTLIPTEFVETGADMALTRGKPHDFSAFADSDIENVKSSMGSFTKLENGDYQHDGTTFRIVPVSSMTASIITVSQKVLGHIEKFMDGKGFPPLRRLNKEEWIKVAEVQRELNVKMFSDMMGNLLGQDGMATAIKATNDPVEGGETAQVDKKPLLH